jgi:hypothetical protein
MQPNKQQSIYKEQPVISLLLKVLPCWVQWFISLYPRPDKSHPRSLLFFDSYNVYSFLYAVYVPQGSPILFWFITPSIKIR